MAHQGRRSRTFGIYHLNHSDKLKEGMSKIFVLTRPHAFGGEPQSSIKICAYCHNGK